MVLVEEETGEENESISVLTPLDERSADNDDSPKSIRGPWSCGLNKGAEDGGLEPDDGISEGACSEEVKDPDFECIWAGSSGTRVITLVKGSFWFKIGVTESKSAKGSTWAIWATGFDLLRYRAGSRVFVRGSLAKSCTKESSKPSRTSSAESTLSDGDFLSASGFCGFSSEDDSL